MNIIEKLQSRRLRKKIEKRTEQLLAVAEQVKILTDLVELGERIKILKANPNVQ